MSTWQLHQGEIPGALVILADDSIDAVVTDPPYELGFMGRRWDSSGVAFRPETWAAVLRVMKPGAHLLAFGGSRTYHRIACAIEEAGFELRDTLMWLYGSGFPKSKDVSDAMAAYLAGQLPDDDRREIPPAVYEITAFVKGARDRAGWTNRQIDELFGTNGMAGHWTSQASQPAVPSFDQWLRLKAALGFGDEMDEAVRAVATEDRPEATGDGRAEPFLSTVTAATFTTGGFGTALKPAYEPIILARKPPAGSTTSNVLRLGTGALNIDACRIADDGEERADRVNTVTLGSSAGGILAAGAPVTVSQHPLGRWPANVLHDGSADVRLHLGDARRFFAQFEWSDEDWLEIHLGLISGVNTAGSYFDLRNEHVASALCRAAASVLREVGLSAVVCRAPSTSATASELRLLVESVTEAIRCIARRSLLGLPPESVTLSGSRVRVAATRAPTGTTTITASRWTSGGSADAVTFGITPRRPEAGDRASERRLHYSAKASTEDREEGTDELEVGTLHRVNPGGLENDPRWAPRQRRNTHLTVKPSGLMEWLVRLVTPPGGLVLDPFTGSGTTGVAALRQGFRFVGFEMEPEHVKIAGARVAWASLHPLERCAKKASRESQPSLFDLAAPAAEEA